MLKCCGILVLLTVVHFVWCEDDVPIAEELKGDVGRAMRDEYVAEHWRAVQPEMETSGWIAAQEQVEEQISSQPMKRRRLRKRKRRPQASEEEAEFQTRPRRRRPVRLDEMSDSWTEMEAESPKKPYNRRRVSPIYTPETHTGVLSATLTFANDDTGTPQENTEPEQRPRRRKRPRTTTEMPTSVQDIKALLKQNGGFSLSEVLQQRNLSLSDLLKGKQQAISALSEKPEVLDHTEPIETTTTHVRKITKIAIKTNSPDKSADDQRKRFGVLYGSNDNKLYSDVTKFDVITEATTEKRIFVPSHPKLYTSVVYRPELGVTEAAVKTTSTEVPDTTTQAPIVTKTTKKLSENLITRPRLKLPVTSAKLHSTVRKQEATTEAITSTTPSNAFKININDLFGFESLTENINIVMGEKENRGPFKMSFDLEELEKQTMEQNTIIPETTSKLTTTTRKVTTRKLISTTATPTTTRTVYIGEKIKAASAKEEIMEILEDATVKDQLTKVLQSRNMTVEELVEQRERGSSQRHLADIFHNKTKEPEPAVEHVGQINMNLMERKPKTTQFNNIPAKKPLPDVSLSSEEILSSEKIPGTSFPTYKIETNKQSKETPPMHIPIWKTVYPGVYTEPIIEKDVLLDSDLKKIDQIENTIAEAVNEGLNNNLATNNDDYDDYLQLPIGVKSAIFASLAIIGISLIVFLTILMIFRWTQRHNKRLCYGGSFSCSKIKSPILSGDPKRSIRTFVSETLGRKKNIYRSHLQSMSDSSWESDRPYQ